MTVASLPIEKIFTVDKAPAKRQVFFSDIARYTPHPANLRIVERCMNYVCDACHWAGRDCRALAARVFRANGFGPAHGRDAACPVFDQHD